MSGKFTKAKQLFGTKPMSRQLQLSLAPSAIAKQAIVGDESERNAKKNGETNYLCSLIILFVM